MSTARVQVDAEHKATQFVIHDSSNPHSRAFHVSWWGFFSSFFSMFAGAQPPRCRTRARLACSRRVHVLARTHLL